MPLSKKEEDTFRKVLSSLLKVSDAQVTTVLEILGPNLDSLTGTGARGGGHKSLVQLTHLIQKVNKNTTFLRAKNRARDPPRTVEPGRNIYGESDLKHLNIHRHTRTHTHTHTLTHTHTHTHTKP